jgi:uncharacterized protein DUF4872/butirosin biosynthesis protein H-like
MLLKSFQPFIGQHCETTTLGNCLQHAGLTISEPLLFGIGQGLNFIYWDMNKMPFPFIGGRSKPDSITQLFCEALNIPVQFAQTTSKQKAWKNATQALEAGQVVGLKLDCYYLVYFTQKVHFAAHYAALYGYDETHAYLADTHQQGPTAKTSLDSLSLARSAKGHMASPSLSFFMTLPTETPELGPVIKHAIKQTALAFLNPPIQNIGYKGIFKMSRKVLKWFERTNNPKADMTLCARLMEKGGTGGSLFRKLYASFLEDAYDITHIPAYHQAAADYRAIAELWTKAATLIEQAGKTQEQKYLNTLSKVLVTVAEQEQKTMENLV